jgi:DNA-binding response OmpR family regulator
MKILVVDDEIKIADVLSARLKLRGFDAIPVYDGTSALTLIRKGSFDGVVLDLRLPDIDGIEILKQTREEFPTIRVIVLSGHGTEQDFETCRNLGAIACFQKPAQMSKLTKALISSATKNDESG